MRFLRQAAGALAAFAAVCAFVSDASKADVKPDPRSLQPTAIKIDATPITSFNRAGAAQARFGKLQFAGGLVLTAREARNFGGWSGLVLDADAKVAE